MKQNGILSIVLTLGLMGSLATTAWANDKEGHERDEHQTKVVKQEAAEKSGMQVVARAKLTRAQAARIALSRAPRGKIKEAELEMEAGVLLWSFDLTMPGATLVAEVGVNAVTGKVVNMELEAPGGGIEKGEKREHRERGEKEDHEAEAHERGKGGDQKAKAHEEEDEEQGEHEHEG